MAGQTADHVTLAAARERLRARVEPVDRTETLELSAADGRVLAEAIDAPRSVPHYRRAAMDGYAVRAADTAGASSASPATLERTDGAVQEGTAVRVDTGCALPDGADAVVRVERTRTDDDRVAVLDPVEPGKDVAPVGEDVTAGQALYDPGHRLRPPDLGVLGSTGIRSVTVRERPTVAVQPTGDELVARDPEPGEVVETNGLTVSRYVDSWGGLPDHRPVVPDDAAALAAAVEAGTSADLLVTLGGSSAGERDLVPQTVAGAGEVFVDGVAIKPGHPVSLGAVDGTPVLMLPGYPVSAVLTAVQLLRPAVHWLQGTSLPPFPATDAVLAEPVASEAGVRRFERVTLADGEATPVRNAGAGALTSVSLADGWVVVPEDRTDLAAGERVVVERWDRPT